MKATKSRGKNATGATPPRSATDRRIAAYVKQFEQLEAQVYKLEAENARLRARIKVLEEAKPGAAIRTMTDDELKEALLPLIEEMGYVKKRK